MKWWERPPLGTRRASKLRGAESVHSFEQVCWNSTATILEGLSFPSSTVEMGQPIADVTYLLASFSTAELHLWNPVHLERITPAWVPDVMYVRNRRIGTPMCLVVLSKGRTARKTQPSCPLVLPQAYFGSFPGWMLPSSVFPWLLELWLWRATLFWGPLSKMRIWASFSFLVCWSRSFQGQM